MSEGTQGHSIEAHAACRFYVDLGDDIKAVFAELTGMQVENVTMDVEEGGTNNFVRKLPGATRVGNLTLKRGLTSGNEFLRWISGVSSGKTQRRNISVAVLDSRGEEVVRWNFRNAFPVKWTGPSMIGSSGEIAFESIELAHDGLEDIGG